MIFRKELTFDEISHILDMKYIDGPTIGYSPPRGIYEITDFNLMLKSLLPNEVKVDVTIDDIGQRSGLATNKIDRLTKKSFFYTLLGFTQSHTDHPQ